MSLPPNFLDELRNRVSLTQVIGRSVVWDPRKSNQGKGDMWAPCPFHQEKTASFHVMDREGYYYCFGCHAKGDAISFLRETQNMSFMEAVAELAREAGMPMPEQDPQAAARAEKRTELTDVMEMAVQHFRLLLKTGAGSQARAYLAGRGLSEEAQARWDIGFAPEARQGLFTHLRDKGVSPEMIVATGLCAKPDDGGAPYDRFRDRIIFPIRDARGRCISLGGRAMAADARAKYLNGPESEIFHKGRALYNHGPARSASGKGAPLIVAEGYMDVIALSEAGFGATVAPLGTAITEDQLQLLWRIHPEPIVALDGDAAGLRAAMRLINVALPLLEAGKSLRFCLLPQGQDPDDLLKAQGASAMQALLDQAQPMVNLLWQRETEGKVFDSPERKATLERDLAKATAQIQDQGLRRLYEDALKDMRWQLYRGARPNAAAGGQGGKRRAAFRPGVAPPATPAPTTRLSPLASGGSDSVEEHLREAVILATLIATPAAITRFESAIERMDLASDDHANLRRAILTHADLPADQLRAAIETDLGAAALEKLHALRHVQIAPALRHPGNQEVAEMCLGEELAKLAAARGARREISDAMADIEASGEDDDALSWRLRQASDAHDRALRSQHEDTAEYDMAPNGARLNRSERDAFADMLRDIERQSADKSE